MLTIFTLSMFGEHVLTYGSNSGVTGGKPGNIGDAAIFDWDFASIGYEYYPSRSAWAGLSARVDGFIDTGVFDPHIANTVYGAIGGGVELGTGVAFRVPFASGRYIQFGLGPFYRFGAYLLANSNATQRLRYDIHSLGLSFDAYFNFATQLSVGILLHFDLGLGDQIDNRDLGIKSDFKQNTTYRFSLGFRVGGRMGE